MYDSEENNAMTMTPEEALSQDDLDAIAILMDDEIREHMHSHYEPGYDNPAAFLAEYKRRHAEKFGKEFEA